MSAPLTPPARQVQVDVHATERGGIAVAESASPDESVARGARGVPADTEFGQYRRCRLR
jgi:hypothetical protein